jgi:hypothetical protein
MKIEFSDKSYLQVSLSETSGKILIILSAKDYSSPLKRITNSCEITKEQLQSIMKEVFS